MIVTKKVVRTYVVEMTEEQRDTLISAITEIGSSSKTSVVDLNEDQFGTLDDLRQSLLNG